MAHETLTLQTPELAGSPERYREIERQFTTDHPAVFEPLKESSGIELITHLYLSHPDEEFNLRVSEVTSHEGTAFRATLKDRGELTPDGLKRIEIETDISEEAFRFYENRGGYAVLRKLRAQPTPGVTIDWYSDNEPPIIEIEDGPDRREAAGFYHRFSPCLLEYTGHPIVSSEALAYKLSPDAKRPSMEEISAEAIIETAMALRAGGAERLVVGIAGRSGSGKSTLTRDVMERLGQGRRQALSVICLSSDDYNRGKVWLDAYNHGNPWRDWDAPITYDTAAMCHELKRLIGGEAIPRRKFDFVTQEARIDGMIEPADIVFLEGISAGSADLAEVRDLLFTLPTPAATSIGRRLRRDFAEGRLNSALGSLADILRYQLEYVEPAHLRRLSDTL